jgi:cell division protein FtsL
VWVTALVTAVALFALVAFHVLAVQHAFELDRLDAQRKAEELRYERLRSEVATLSAPESVVDAARALGMLPASDVDYIEAEAAAPSETAPDATSSTLVEVYGEAKRSLDP